MFSGLLIKEPKNLVRKSVIYNVGANLLNAAASVILLMFVTRVCGTSQAGVFSIGFSTAQMLLPIGQFGMRNFQASDVVGKFSQHDYIASRIITNIIMMAIAIGFVFVKGYYFDKASILIVLCLLKVTDAFDDVFGGYYQLNNRLDISGKMQITRIASYCIGFTIVLVATKNVLLACVAAFVISAVILVLIVVDVKKLFPVVTPAFNGSRLKRLLLDCLPLCVGAFLVLYMGNAPKYAIDSYMPSEYQAIYNYLFMPCYVITLFVSFVLQPLLVKMSKTWVEKRYNSFKKICTAIIGATVLLSIVIVIFGYFLGCPLLGWLYGVDLMEYQFPFTVLLFGGIGYALATIVQTILTVMRHQFIILFGFVASSVIITILAPIFVSQSGIDGAAWAYLIAAMVLFVILLICFFVSYFKEMRKAKCEEVNAGSKV